MEIERLRKDIKGILKTYVGEKASKETKNLLEYKLRECLEEYKRLGLIDGSIDFVVTIEESWKLNTYNLTLTPSNIKTKELLEQIGPLKV